MTKPDLEDKKRQKDQPAEAQIQRLTDLRCGFATDLQDLIAKFKEEQVAWRDKLKSQIDDVEKMCLRDEGQLRQVTRDLGSVQRILSAIYDEKIFEHQVYGTELSELIKNAWFAIRSPRTVDKIFNWGLKPEQRSIKPYEYDVIAGIYLLSKRRLAANSNTLDGMVLGKNKGEIKRSAENLMKRGYVKEQHSQAARKKRGPRPTNFKLTPDGLALLLSSGSPSTRDLKTHRDMELKRFRQAIRQRPMEAYMSTRQIPGVRCAAIVRGRKDSENFSEEVRAINIVTHKDVQQDSSTQPDQVCLNMVTPFTFGAKRLEIVHKKTSLRTLMELWNTLPQWLRERIDFNEV
jgi:hypothetical protein